MMKQVVFFMVLAVLVAGCTGGGDDAGSGMDDAGVSADAKNDGGDAGSQQDMADAGSQGTPSQSQSGADNQAADDSGSGMMEKLNDMKKAMLSGDTYKCTYTYMGSRMTTFVKGEKYYSDIQAEGMNMYSMSDGVWVYMWSKADDSGSKMRIEDFKDSEAETEESDYQDIDKIAAEGMQMECERTSVPDSMFREPSGIDFTDLGAMLANMQKMSEEGDVQGMMDDSCSMCEMIPDASAKAQCLENC